ncbi:MAG TPA: hypothetical protein VME41_00830 [Stellaceae bacterium]|nr:hypothetical protein [Stellaceae bacterium]
MRFLPLLAVLGVVSAFGFGPANAATTGINMRLDHAASRPIVAVRWECSPVSCINSQTGAYTQSGCDAGGCHPTSGVIGYTNRGQAHQDWHIFHGQ